MTNQDIENMMKENREMKMQLQKLQGQSELGGPMSAIGGQPGHEVKSSMSHIGAKTNVDLSPRSQLVS